MFAIDSIDDGLRVTWDGSLVLDYNFQTGGPRPYWHPLRLPDSPVLTMDRPQDHVHHQGMWVGWKRINGVNFWEQPKPDADPSGFGRIAHKKVLYRYADSDFAGFSSENGWVDWQGVVHLDEVRRTLVHAPQDNYMMLDAALQFSSKAPASTLDLSRGEPGLGGLFYSGLTIRFDNAMTPGRLLDADGRTRPMDVFGSRSRWCSYVGRHQEDGKLYGTAILDHPDNPRYPTTWWVRNAENYALIQPGLCYHEPFKLCADALLKLNYTVLLHRDQVEPDLIERVAARAGKQLS